jgi:hypothetical protein
LCFRSIGRIYPSARGGLVLLIAVFIVIASNHFATVYSWSQSFLFDVA